MADVQVVRASSKGRCEDHSLLLGMHIALDTNWLASLHMPMTVTNHIVFSQKKA